MMKIKASTTIWLQIFISLLSLLCTAAGKVQVTLGPDKAVSYSLERTNFLSDKAKKNLNSGLSTKAVVLARLIELPAKPISEQLNTIESKYDLWDEKFYVFSSSAKKLEIQKQSDLEKLFEASGPFKWFSLSSLQKGKSYKIEVVETLNPIDKDKFDSLQKWVTQQRSSLRGIGTNPEASVMEVVPETSFSTLFYSLWKRASEGDQFTGDLTRHEESEPFTSESLK